MSAARPWPATASPASALRAGILGLATARLRVHGNEITDLGPVADFGRIASGVIVLGTHCQLDVRHYDIERDSVPTEASGRVGWFGLLVSVAVAQDTTVVATLAKQFGRRATRRSRRRRVPGVVVRAVAPVGHVSVRG